eukprot:gene2354-1483_t
MSTLQIKGMSVVFPFTPYTVQIKYMECVIEALNSGTTALMESPTGTGKTICLLCATLAWVEHKKRQEALGGIPRDPNGAPKILYCSRTHSQLSQVINEMKCSPYKHMSVAVLGSKEHCCVNSEVAQLPTSSSRTHACSVLRSENRCRFFNATRMPNSHSREDGAILDMEDLVKQGKTQVFCPYYAERERSKTADIIFMPYNYVVDPSLRKQLPFSIDKNCIVVVDEAHNLPAVLSSMGCVNLTALSLATAIQDCGRAMAMLLVEAGNGLESLQDSMQVSEQDIAALKIVLKKLEEEIDSLSLSQECSTEKQTAFAAPGELIREGEFMLKFLEDALISAEVYLGTLRGLGMKAVIGETIKVLSKSDKAAGGLAAVQNFLDSVFSAVDNDLSSTKFVLQEQQETTGRQRLRRHRSVGFWRLESTEMRQIQGLAHSLLLTSGTLSPLDHFAAELNISCGVRLSCSHVIEKEQLVSSVMSKGPSGERLNGSFAYRANTDYRIGIGSGILNISRHVQGGTLVFFPSYAALYGAVDLWKAGTTGSAKTVWGLLSECKPVFLEPSDNADLRATVQKFKETVDSTSAGAILLAVCRGKISEGVNFSDRHGRCVIVTGIPYANHTDLFVRLKRKYLTDVSSSRPKVQGKPFTGEDWYRSEAMRAVSQCVGRVIRHKNDFGAIVLADERFKELTACLPAWVQPTLSIGVNFRDTYALVAQFFGQWHKMEETKKTRDNATNLPSSPLVGPYSPVRDSPPTEVAAQEDVQKARAYLVAQIEKDALTSSAKKKIRYEEEHEAPREGRGVCSSNSSGVQTPRMVKQVLPVQHFSKIVLEDDTISRIGSTSKEFCAFLKENLSTLQYEVFKRCLMEIASARRTIASSSTPHELLGPIVERVAAVFRRVSVCPPNLLLLEFGRYIPEELRGHYAKDMCTHIVVREDVPSFCWKLREALNASLSFRPMSIVPGYPVPEQLWVKASDSCASCGELFTLRTKKVNCPNCGQLLCSNCVSSGCPIMINGPPVEVCLMCMEMIQDFIKENNIVLDGQSLATDSTQLPAPMETASKDVLENAGDMQEKLVRLQEEIEENNGTISTLPTQIHNTNTVAAQLQKGCPTTSSLPDEVISLKNEVARLQSSLECEEAHKRETAAAMNEEKEKRLELQNELARLKDENILNKDRYEEEKTRNEEMHIKRLHSEGELQSLREEKNNVEKANKTLATALEELQQKYQQLEKFKNDQINALQGQLKASTHRVEELEAECRDLRQEGRISRPTNYLRDEEENRSEEASRSSTQREGEKQRDTHRQDDDKPTIKPFAQAMNGGKGHWSHNSIVRNITYPSFVSSEDLAFDEAAKLPSRDSLFMWGYDVMNGAQHVRSILQVMAHEAATRWGLFDEEEMNRWHQFVAAIESNYPSNPYHSSIHAADVLQTMVVLIEESGIVNALSQIEKVATLVAPIVHDVRHPGRTQAFLRSSLDPVFLQYGGHSVLEQMHLSTAVALLSESHLDFTRKWSEADALLFFETISSMVWATDMANHFSLLESYSKNESTVAVDVTNPGVRRSVLGLVLHAADIGNQTKGVEVSLGWRGLFDEAREQRSEEEAKGYSPSFLPPTDGVEMLRGQLQFIQSFVYPLYHTLQQVLPSLPPFAINGLEKVHTYYANKLGETIPFPPEKVGSSGVRKTACLPPEGSIDIEREPSPSSAQIKDAALRLRRAADLLSQRTKELDNRERKIIEQEKQLRRAVSQQAQAKSEMMTDTRSPTNEELTLLAQQLREERKSLSRRTPSHPPAGIRRHWQSAGIGPKKKEQMEDSLLVDGLQLQCEKT